MQRQRLAWTWDWALSWACAHVGWAHLKLPIKKGEAVDWTRPSPFCSLFVWSSWASELRRGLLCIGFWKDVGASIWASGHGHSAGMWGIAERRKERGGQSNFCGSNLKFIIFKQTLLAWLNCTVSLGAFRGVYFMNFGCKPQQFLDYVHPWKLKSTWLSTPKSTT